MIKLVDSLIRHSLPNYRWSLPRLYGPKRIHKSPLGAHSEHRTERGSSASDSYRCDGATTCVLYGSGVITAYMDGPKVTFLLVIAFAVVTMQIALCAKWQIVKPKV